LHGALVDAMREETSSDYVITRYRSPNCNRRTHFERIIRNAGLTP